VERSGELPESPALINETIDIALPTEQSNVGNVEAIMAGHRDSSMEPSLWRADSSEISSVLRKAEASEAEQRRLHPVGMMAMLARPLFPGRFDLLGSVTVLHAGAAGLAVLALIAIVGLATGGEDEQEPVAQTKTSVERPSVTTVKAAARTGAKEPVASQPGGRPEREKAVVEHKCLPFAKNPSFPWHSELATMLTTATTSGVCGLFGRDAKTLYEQLAALFSGPPTGYDLLPQGQLIEASPESTGALKGLRLQLIFASAGLIELRLNYGDRLTDNLDESAFVSVFGEPWTSVDEQGRTVQRFKDSDLIVEILTKRDKYRRVFRELRFSSAPLAASLGDAMEKRRKVESALARGLEKRAERRLIEANDWFAKALSLAPEVGQARIWLAMLALANERFDQVEKQAGLVLETSRDRRMHAEAKGLLGVVALAKGNAEDAWARFSEAAAIDPMNPELLQSARELETKAYAPERVAKTASRLECLVKKEARGKKKRTKSPPPPWTERGLLARGNFPSRAVYETALASAADKPEFKAAKKMWTRWECP
jgi:tetratricopeptide (TPR) repeat protein